MARERKKVYNEGNKTFYVDKEVEIDIKGLEEKNKEKLNVALLRYFSLISSNRAVTKDKYGQEGRINSKLRITAIKFKSINNARIYCREEIKDDGKLEITLCCLLKSKKQTKNNQEITNIINRVKNYEY